jgi:hypothetical protein
MVSKVILAPIVILALLAVVSMVGLGVGQLGTFSIGSTSFSPTTATYYYDANGNPKVYANNLTAVAEPGSIVHLYYLTPVGAVVSKYAGWENASSGSMGENGAYELYTDAHGQDALVYTSVNPFYNPPQNANAGGTPSGQQVNLDIAGLIVVLSIVLIAAGVAGFHFLGSGESETSVAVLLKIGTMLGIWGVFSGLSYTLLLLLPDLMGIYLYLGLTFFFVVGMIDTIGHPSQ